MVRYQAGGMRNGMSKKLWALSLAEKWGKRTQMFVWRKMTIVVTCPPWVNANRVTSIGTEKGRPRKYLTLQEWHHSWNCSNQKINMSLLCKSCSSTISSNHEKNNLHAYSYIHNQTVVRCTRDLTKFGGCNQEMSLAVKSKRTTRFARGHRDVTETQLFITVTKIL